MVVSERKKNSSKKFVVDLFLCSYVINLVKRIMINCFGLNLNNM